MNFSNFFKFKILLITAILISSFSTFAKASQNLITLPSFAPLVEQTMPAVVNISTTQSVEIARGQGLPRGFRFHFPDSPEFDLFREFFDHEFDGGGKDGGENTHKKRAASLGSGFIIDPKGFIVTNHHVIAEADEINVTVVEGDEEKTFPAKLIGSDKKTDLAVLKIDTKKELPFIKFGSSKQSKVGDWVVAIGNPFGLGGTVTTGIISAKSRFIAGQYDEFIQTDASINRGNSGGPMLNLAGEVIGVNSVIISPSGGNVGIGFAIPSDSAAAIVEQLRKKGAITRSWLGVKIQSITDDISKNLGFKDNKGALVAEVIENSPAQKGGIKVGDVIVKFDGQVVDKMPRLPSIVAETAINKKVKVEVIRNGKIKTLNIMTEKMEDGEASDKNTNEEKNSEESSKVAKISGMRLENLNATNRAKFKLNKDDKGVLISQVNRNSSAADSGVRPGDIIKRVNNSKVDSVDQVEKVFETAKKSGSKTLVMLISRDGSNQFIVMYLD